MTPLKSVRMDNYVRLPFEDNRDSLPNNYKLAHRRLVTVMQKLSEKPGLLQQYDDVFKDQVQKGIIEKAINREPSNASVVHYLPHQAVITPQKETTKVGIVFDASSHYKDCPSLNEVLYQVPTLLPELYGMLLRFRVKPFLSIPDVEKAFLQIRLQEAEMRQGSCGCET
ncbi:hypothetical protein ANCDUO_00468 [Ancylostoma duodenale]|uniref:Uncharacterized protein n=1 Tax=Ancylostoma duodenale TaxID=51022 RepID=A0A0C2HBZ3_9BILA|nr:hypothetical protein ANCDUO_00468 [Ancylostoma duodenale]